MGRVLKDYLVNHLQAEIKIRKEDVTFLSDALDTIENGFDFEHAEYKAQYYFRGDKGQEVKTSFISEGLEHAVKGGDSTFRLFNKTKPRDGIIPFQVYVNINGIYFHIDRSFYEDYLS